MSGVPCLAFQAAGHVLHGYGDWCKVRVAQHDQATIKSFQMEVNRQSSTTAKAGAAIGSGVLNNQAGHGSRSNLGFRESSLRAAMLFCPCPVMYYSPRAKANSSPTS
jgi:hypothetical protein